MSIIYKLKSPSGKEYIGLTTREFETRMQEHFNNRNLKKYAHLSLYRAINKYGWDSFEKEIIFEADVTIEHLRELEIFFIDKYDTFYSGYNNTLGGEATYGHVWTEEQKEKLRESRRANPVTDEQREAMKSRMSGENNHMYGIRGKDAPSARAVRVEELDMEFDTIKECCAYLLNNGLVETISTGNVSSACARKHSFKRGKYRGFTFNYK